jgi:hypothetical protein
MQAPPPEMPFWQQRSAPQVRILFYDMHFYPFGATDHYTYQKHYLKKIYQINIHGMCLLVHISNHSSSV